MTALPTRRRRIGEVGQGPFMLTSLARWRLCSGRRWVLAALDQTRLEGRAGMGRAAALGENGSSNWPISVSGAGVEVP